MTKEGLKHLAVIMDGNRRWAKAQGLPSFEGHRRGYDRLKAIGDACLARGVEVLTVFAFSTENWKRTQEEVTFLMDLLETALIQEAEFFVQKGVRVLILGRRDGLRPSVLRAIESIETRTAENTALTLCICLNYGGRIELVDAVRNIVAQGIEAGQIEESTVTSATYWPDMPEPDLVVRTSGEQRLSGFLLWQCAYSEFYFTEVHWPAFTEAELDRALDEFGQRQRRYGK